MISKHKHLKTMCVQEYLEKLSRQDKYVHLRLSIMLKPIEELKRVLGDSLVTKFKTTLEMERIMKKDYRKPLNLDCTIYNYDTPHKVEYMGYNWTANCFEIEIKNELLKDFL